MNYLLLLIGIAACCIWNIDASSVVGYCSSQDCSGSGIHLNVGSGNCIGNTYSLCDSNVTITVYFKSYISANILYITEYADDACINQLSVLDGQTCATCSPSLNTSTHFICSDSSVIQFSMFLFLCFVFFSF